MGYTVLQLKLLCWHWCLIKLRWQNWEYKPLNVWFWQQSHCQREVFLFRCYYRIACFSVMYFFTFLISLSSCDKQSLRVFPYERSFSERTSSDSWEERWVLQQCHVNRGGFLSGVCYLRGRFFSLFGLPGCQRGSQSSGERDSTAMLLHVWL